VTTTRETTQPPAFALARSTLGFLIAGLGLIACAVVALVVDREVDRQMAGALALQRIHIERVAAIENAARNTYVLMLERWLRPLSEWRTRERAIEQAVADIRRKTAEFSAEEALSSSEAEARNRLVVSIALWSNRVQQAVVASDGPSATGEVRVLIDEVQGSAEDVAAIDSVAGTSTDKRVEELHSRQTLAQSALVAAAVVVLGLAARWWRDRARVQRRLRASEQARKEAQSAERLRMQFFANTSHELRTPLVAIRGFSALIDDAANGIPKVHDAAIEIDREAADLLGQIDNILQAAKIGHGGVEVTLSDVDLEQIVRRCVLRCTALIGAKPVELAVELDGSVPRVRSDAVKLTHVFSNLLVNAIKFTPSGRVTVRIPKPHDEQVVVEVSDTGIGMPADALERIWNPFEQADMTVQKRFGGTGLGLSIVRAFLDKMGGQVTVQSVEGQGTTFAVTLPVAASEGVGAEAGEAVNGA
jgi:signal transduction histidine kinase